MPRLDHRKAKTGCTRCKARKVKCDETKPKCAACTRHGVECQYPFSASSRKRVLHRSCSSDDLKDDHSHRALSFSDTQCPGSLRLDHNLELRLMHNWTANTSKTLGMVWAYWAYQAPLVALEHRHVMDALLALSARHASHQPLSQWVSLEGRMVPLTDPTYTLYATQPPSQSWDIGSDKLEALNAAITSQARAERNTDIMAHALNCKNLLVYSRVYFDRALEGHRRALEHLTVDNIESVYVTSLLISKTALATLAEDDNVATDDPRMAPMDPILWFRVGFGIRNICERWHELVGPEWMLKSGVLYGQPDLMNKDEIFAVENGRVFEKLLTHGVEYEIQSEEDTTAYQMAVSYIGLIHKMIVGNEEEPLATYRRFLAMPTVQHPRFFELLEGKAPRAIVIIAHTFALMKMRADALFWFRGLAEKQIPRLSEQLPPAWKSMMKWPLSIKVESF